MNGCLPNNYINHFPTDVPRIAAQSFVATTVIYLVSGVSATGALAVGGMAALATGIEAITRPIIRSIFPEHPTIAVCIQFCLPKMLALGLVSSIAPWIAFSYKVSSFCLSMLAWLVLVEEDFYGKNIAMVEVL